VQPLDLPLAVGCRRRTALERPARLILKLLFPGVDLIGLYLVAKSATVACSRSASKAIFAFSVASILRLVFCAMFRSI
jgi:hypothetical protein